MANAIPHEEIGGEGVHVRDCYVWTEISYLDSSSDFREYLPQVRQWKPNHDRLVMLDIPRRSARELFSGSLLGDAFAGSAVVAVTILTIFFFDVPTKLFFLSVTTRLSSSRRTASLFGPSTWPSPPAT